MNYGTRYDRKTGQYVPQVDGNDVSPTSFDEKRALEVARQTAEGADRKARHTAGPWEYYKTRSSQVAENHVIAAHANDDGREIAVGIILPVSDDGQDGGESNCNARLIAAAPDLAAALAEIKALGMAGVVEQRETGKPTWTLTNEIARIARAALEKAGVA